MSPPADGTVPAAVSSAAHGPTDAPRKRRPSVPDGAILGTGPAETAGERKRRAKRALRAARAAAGLSQAALADLLDVDCSLVKRWEEEASDNRVPVDLLFDGGLPAAFWATFKAHIEAERGYYDRSHLLASAECEATSTVATAGHLLARIGADLLDGRITDEEAAATLPAVVRAQRQLDALAASLARRAGGR